MRIRACPLILLGPLVALPGCNSGLAGLVAAATDSGDSAMVPTTVSNVTVRDSKNSPAEIGFTLAGETADAVHIEYRLAPGPRGSAGYVPIATLGADDLNISPSGAANQFDWDFAGDLGTGFVDGLTVRVRLASGASATTGQSISVGNSPPVISPFSFPATEIVGVVGMLFTVADTGDTVSLSVEVNSDADNDFPAGSWETALPGLGQEIAPFVAVESGTTVPFFWDVIGQFGPLDSEVMVRATAVDTADPGEEPLQHQVEASSVLRVDNNAPPAVSLNVSPFTQSDDSRRGIVVPYTVSDAEGDTLDLVFQWTLEGEPFVDLPSDEELVEEILADPALRKQYRVATPYPGPIGGLARPTGEADTALLPELGSSQSHLLQVAEQPGGDLGAALDGFELELLRPSGIPGPLAATWSANPLDGPVAALPASDTTTAYILDRAGGMTWQVREIDLATGAVLATLATGAGEPDTMTMERGGAALLVAAHDFNVRVCRIDLDTLEVLAIFDGPGPLPGDTIRGLASVGSEVALATLGDELLRLNYADPFATQITTVLDGLATRVVADPVHTNRVYLAEHDFAGSGRVLSLDLYSRAAVALPGASPGLLHPEALAIERGGRLLVLTDEAPADGFKELRAIELGSTTVDLLTTELPESATSLEVGNENLRLLCLSSGNDLAAAGGVVQRRTIVAYDPTRRVATVDAAFAPILSSAQPWRVQAPDQLVLAAGVPRSSAFVWDSRDLPGAQGRALLRLTARDADASDFEHDGGKKILSGLGGEPLSLGGMGTTAANGVATGDLDGDGDLDIVSANLFTSLITVFFQTEAGVFDSVTSTLGGPGTTAGAQGVATADLDGDGDLDIVSANGGTPPAFSDSRLTVFFQTAPGVFDPVPSLTLGEPSTTVFARFVEAADLDGDGDLDLVSSNANIGTLTVYFQTGAGVFDPVPSLVLGGLMTTGAQFSSAVADLDGDGDLDLASATSFGLAAYLQTGVGVFDPIPTFTLDFGFSTSVAATDLDGDGDADLVATPPSESTLAVFFQTGAGVFGPDPSLILGGPETTPFANFVVAADLDGDGDADIVNSNLVGDTCTVFLQESAGVFDPVPAVALGSMATTDQPLAVAVADLDGNGTADLVSANQFTDIAVFLQTGAGVFDSDPSLTLGTIQTSAFPAGVAAADLDGDGDTDLVSANLAVSVVTSSLTVFFQTQTGVFDPLPSLTLGGPSTNDGAADLVAADLDGDGDTDLVSANGHDLFVGDGGTPKGQDPIITVALDTVTVFFQTEPGVFDPEPSLTLGGPLTTDGASSVEAADLDGDGDLDLVTANQIAGTLTVFFQAGAGVFDPVPSLTLGGQGTTEGAAFVAARDLDGDGDLDLVSANGFDQTDPHPPESHVVGSDTITVFFQTEPGVFDLAPSLVLGGPAMTDGVLSVVAADVDGDGDVDLVSANAHSNTLTVFFQTEPGVFDLVPSLTLDSPQANDSPRSVTAADLDEDGDMDLVAANHGSNTITRYFQRGAGGFDTKTSILSGPPTTTRDAVVSVVVADLDGDGDADIASGNGNSANLTVFYGTHQP